MTDVPKWRRYLRFWRADVAGDVDDELRFHFEARREELRARGLPPADVERTIAEEFGDVEATRRRLREIGERVERRRERLRWWHQLRAARLEVEAQLVVDVRGDVGAPEAAIAAPQRSPRRVRHAVPPGALGGRRGRPGAGRARRGDTHAGPAGSIPSTVDTIKG